MSLLSMIPVDVLIRAVGGAVRAVANDPHTPLQPTQAPAVERQIKEAIKKSPEIRHVTNNESWYQSRVTIGALVTMASGGLALAGFALDAEDIALVTNAALGLGSVIGAAITLYGRWKAKKPLGT